MGATHAGAELRRQNSTEDVEVAPNAKPPPALEAPAPVVGAAPKAEAPAKAEPLPNENPELEPAPVLAPKPPNAGAAPVVLAPLALSPPNPAPKDTGADACDPAALLLASVLVSLGAEPKALPPPNEKAGGAAADATLLAPVSVDEDVVNPNLGAPAAGAASVELEAAALELVVFAPPKEKPAPAFGTSKNGTDSAPYALHAWRARQCAPPLARCRLALARVFFRTVPWW